MTALNIYKDRTNTYPLSLGINVSDDTLTCEIREGKTSDTTLIATGSITFLTDGEDGECVLTIDDSELDEVTQTKGYLDVKRVTGGEPVPVFATPIRVRFHGNVTA